MRTLLIILVSSIILVSCKRSGTNPTPPATNQTVQTPVVEQAPPQQASVPREIKYFTGSIGNTQGLKVKLVREGDKLTGSYSYQNVGASIELKGSVDKDSYVNIEEFDTAGKQTGIFKGLWASKEDGALNIAGNWSRPDGSRKTAFSLHEEPIHFSGAAEFTVKKVKESNKKRNYTIDAEYPQLTGLLSPGFEKFNQEVTRLVQRKISEFKKNLEEVPEMTTEQTTSGNSLDIGYSIALATDDLISIQFEIGTYYSGAAHPNSISQVLNFEVEKLRTLRLRDVFKPGAKYLEALSSFAIKDLKKQSAANGPNGLLDEASIERGARPSIKNFESWTITRKGLGINFDAYQVGPYAAGPQHVLVPFSALKGLVEASGPWGKYVK